MLEILKLNFKELLQTFVAKPWVGLVLFFMFLSGYFMNKWSKSNINCNIRIEEIQQQKDSLVAISFNRLIELQKLQTMLEVERRTYDSLLRVRLENENKKLRDNVRFE